MTQNSKSIWDLPINKNDNFTGHNMKKGNGFLHSFLILKIGINNMKLNIFYNNKFILIHTFNRKGG